MADLVDESLALMMAGSSMQLLSSGPGGSVSIHPIMLWFEAATSPTKLGQICYCYVEEGSKQKRDALASIPLSKIADVFLGAQQPLFKHPTVVERKFPSTRCFSLASRSLTLHLIADSDEERTAWLRGIKGSFTQAQKARKQAGAGAASAAAASSPAAAAAAPPAPPLLDVLKPLLQAGQRCHLLSLGAAGDLSIKPVLLWWQESDDVSLGPRGQMLGEICYVHCAEDASPASFEGLRQKIAGQSLPLKHIADVFRGAVRPIFKSAAVSFASDRCFTLDARYKSLDLVAASKADREVIINCIQQMFVALKRRKQEEEGAEVAAAAASSVPSVDAPVSLNGITLSGLPSSAAAAPSSSSTPKPYFSEPRSFLSVELDPSAPGGIIARTIWVRHQPSPSGPGSLHWNSSSADTAVDPSRSLDLRLVKHLWSGTGSETLSHAVRFSALHLVEIDPQAAFSLLDAQGNAGWHLVAPSTEARKLAIDALREIMHTPQQPYRKRSGEHAAASAVASSPAAPAPSAAIPLAAAPSTVTSSPASSSAGAGLPLVCESAPNSAPPSQLEMDSSQPGRAADSSQPGRMEPPPERQPSPQSQQQLQQPKQGVQEQQPLLAGKPLKEIQAPVQKPKRKKNLWQRLTCAADYGD